MTEQQFLAAVDEAVTRWFHDRGGESLSCIAFDQAVPAQCHANADAFVAQHGGEVVRGFLIQHPDGWPTVWVMAHSVVRTSDCLVDVTLEPAQLRGLAFFTVEGQVDGFTEWAKLRPRETRPVPNTLSRPA